MDDVTIHPSMRQAMLAVEDLLTRNGWTLDDGSVVSIARELSKQANVVTTTHPEDATQEQLMKRALEQAIADWTERLPKLPRTGIKRQLELGQLVDAVLGFRVEYETTGHPANWYELENLIPEAEYPAYRMRWSEVLAGLRSMPRTSKSRFFSRGKQLIMTDMTTDGRQDIRSALGGRYSDEYSNRGITQANLEVIKQVTQPAPEYDVVRDQHNQAISRRGIR